MSITKFYVRHKEGLFYGALWGVIAVAIGSTINTLIDALNQIGDFLLEAIKWIIILPFKIGSIFGTGKWLWIVAIIAGVLLGPLMLYVLKLIWRLFKRSPI